MSSESSSASSLLTEVIRKVATNAPSAGDSTNLNITNFTLQTIVPRKPYFAYVSERIDWIVYGALEAIPLSSNTLKTLQQIIKPFMLPTPGDALFYNSNGPITGVPVGDGIYISCKPTGSFGEDVGVMYDKPSTSVDFSNIANSPLLQFLLIMWVMIIVFLLLFYGIGSVFSSLSLSLGGEFGAEPSK